MLFFCHIFKGVQGGEGPQCGDKPCKDYTHAVHLEADGQIACKMRQQKGAVRVVQQQIPYQNAVYNDCAFQKDFHMPAFFKREHRHQCTCNYGN